MSAIEKCIKHSENVGIDLLPNTIGKKVMKRVEEARAELTSLREKAAWYDKVHEAKEPDYFNELDAAGLREQLRIASHLAAERMDAANIPPRELDRLRELAGLVPGLLDCRGIDCDAVVIDDEKYICVACGTKLEDNWESCPNPNCPRFKGWELTETENYYYPRKRSEYDEMKVRAELVQKDGKDGALVKALDKCHHELNIIRARDGVPYTAIGYKSDIDEDYFIGIVDLGSEALKLAREAQNAD